MTAALRRAASIDDLRALARRRLPRMVFDYIDGAAGSEITAMRNRAALASVLLEQDVLVDVESRSLQTELFGKQINFPLVIGPTGLNGAAWNQGDVCLARAAAKAGIPFTMSTAATTDLAGVDRAAGHLRWFQLYMLRDRGIVQDLLTLLSKYGFDVLQLTVDTAVGGRRNRDIRNGFTLPFRWTLSNALDCARHHKWATQMLRQGAPELRLFAELLGGKTRAKTISEVMQKQISASFTWADIAWLREQWSGKLVLKGLISAAHASQARELGLDGAVISNHGGRQLDGTTSTIEALPSFVDACRRELTVLIDSGFRSGSEVAKALAFGADAVQLGRATLYGLAAGGEAGVSRAIEILAHELDSTMALCGATTIRGLRNRAQFARALAEFPM